MEDHNWSLSSPSDLNITTLVYVIADFSIKKPETSENLRTNLIGITIQNIICTYLNQTGINSLTKL